MIRQKKSKLIKYLFAILAFSCVILLNKFDVQAEELTVNLHTYREDIDEKDGLETGELDTEVGTLEIRMLYSNNKSNHTFKGFGAKDAAGEFVKKEDGSVLLAKRENNKVTINYDEWKDYFIDGTLDLYCYFEENYFIYLTIYKPGTENTTKEIYTSSTNMVYDKYKMYIPGSYELGRAGACDGKEIVSWTCDGVTYPVGTRIEESTHPDFKGKEFIGNWSDIIITLVLGDGASFSKDGFTTTIKISDYAGDTVTFPGRSAVQKDGYLLLGWSSINNQTTTISKTFFQGDTVDSFEVPKSTFGISQNYYAIWGRSTKVKVYNLEGDSTPLYEGECFESYEVIRANKPDASGITTPPYKVAFKVETTPSNGDDHTEFAGFAAKGNGLESGIINPDSRNKYLEITPSSYSSYIVDGTLNFYAKYDDKLHFIKKYNEPAGSSIYTNVDTYLASNEYLDVRVPNGVKPNGYKLLGWDDGGITDTSEAYIDSFYISISSASNPYKGMNEVTFTAHWEPITITLDSGMETFPEGYSNSYKYDEINGTTFAVPPKDVMHKDGYSFNGWSKTSASATSPDFDANTTEINKLAMGSSDITIYAVWVERADFKFYNDGTLSRTVPVNKDAAYGRTSVSYDSYSLPTKSGHDFIGWQVTGNSKTSEVLDAYKSFTYSEFEEYIEDNTVTVNAVFKKKLKVVYNYNQPANSTPVNSNSEITVSLDQAGLTLPRPASNVNGFKFTGWMCDYDSSKHVAGDSLRYNKDSYYDAPNDTITFYGQWEAYKLTLDIGDAVLSDGYYSEYSYDPARPNADVIIPGYKNISKEGYYLKGWTSIENSTDVRFDSNNGGVSVSYAYANFKTSDVTLYPIWDQSIKVTYSYGDSETVRYYIPVESDYLDTEIFSLSGSTFKCYEDSSHNTYSTNSTIQYVSSQTKNMEFVLSPVFLQNLIVYVYKDLERTDTAQFIIPFNQSPTDISNAFTRTNYSLVGWSFDGTNLDTNFNGNVYYDIFTEKYGYSVYLYAMWEHDIVITYHGETTNTETYVAGLHDAKLYLSNPSDALTGWTTGSDGTGTFYPVGVALEYSQFVNKTPDLYPVYKTENEGSQANPSLDGFGRIRITNRVCSFTNVETFTVDSDPTVYTTKKFSVPYTGYFTFTRK